MRAVPVHLRLVALTLLTCAALHAHADLPTYYDVSERAKAQAEARQKHLPLAWVGVFPQNLQGAAQVQGDQTDLTEMALEALSGNAVIITLDGHNIGMLPEPVRRQFAIRDDANLPPDALWFVPRVVFSNPDATKALGRVTFTQMRSDRDIPINRILQLIRHDPTALSGPSDPPPAQVQRPVTAISGLPDFWPVWPGIVLMILFWVWLVREPRRPPEPRTRSPFDKTDKRVQG